MIKALRKKKLDEIENNLAKPGKFNPVHSPDPYNASKDTPNSFAHRKVQEAVSKTVHSGLGGSHKPKRALFPSNLGDLKARAGWQSGATNQKRTPGTYGNKYKPVTEEEQELDKTDAGDKVKKKKTETINLEPQQSDEKIF